jgi:RHS repeat-associated protein
LTFVYLLDGLRSVWELLTAGQAVSDSYVYDAFGNTVASSGSTVNPHGYVGSLGYRSGSLSGLQHVGAREYNPATGRFLTQDPIGYAGGLNLYGYVENSPTGRVDPEGLFPKDGNEDLRQELLDAYKGPRINGSKAIKDIILKPLLNWIILPGIGELSGILGGGGRVVGAISKAGNVARAGVECAEYGQLTKLSPMEMEQFYAVGR